jgi:hypothetical protein
VASRRRRLPSQFGRDSRRQVRVRPRGATPELPLLGLAGQESFSPASARLRLDHASAEHVLEEWYEPAWARTSFVSSIVMIPDGLRLSNRRRKRRVHVVNSWAPTFNDRVALVTRRVAPLRTSWQFGALGKGSCGQGPRLRTVTELEAYVATRL